MRTNFFVILWLEGPPCGTFTLSHEEDKGGYPMHKDLLPEYAMSEDEAFNLAARVYHFYAAVLLQNFCVYLIEK